MAINEPEEYDLSNTGSLMLDLEMIDEAVRLQGRDEMATCFDPDTHPKAYKGMQGPDDPVADGSGNIVDIEADTGSIGRHVGPTDRDIFADPLPEFDDLGALEPDDDDIMGDLL